MFHISRIRWASEKISMDKKLWHLFNIPQMSIFFRNLANSWSYQTKVSRKSTLVSFPLFAPEIGTTAKIKQFGPPCITLVERAVIANVFIKMQWSNNFADFVRNFCNLCPIIVTYVGVHVLQMHSDGKNGNAASEYLRIKLRPPWPCSIQLFALRECLTLGFVKSQMPDFRFKSSARGLKSAVRASHTRNGDGASIVRQNSRDTSAYQLVNKLPTCLEHNASLSMQ